MLTITLKILTPGIKIQCYKHRYPKILSFANEPPRIYNLPFIKTLCIEIILYMYIKFTSALILNVNEKYILLL